MNASIILKIFNLKHLSRGLGVTSRTVQILSSSKLFHDPILCLGTPLFCQVTDDFIIQKSAGTHTEVWLLFHILLSF